MELTIEYPISNAEDMAAPASGRQAQHPNGVSDERLAPCKSLVKKGNLLKPFHLNFQKIEYLFQFISENLFILLKKRIKPSNNKNP